jgi:S-adenosylmethionine/arginine decarboxylase-like enzyme
LAAIGILKTGWIHKSYECAAISVPHFRTGRMTEDEYLSTHSWGIQVSLDLHGCNPATIRDAEMVRKHVYELCDLIKVIRFGDCQVVHFADHNEDVAGFSMVQLIETSLISGHYANKSNNVFLDVFSCKYYDPDLVASFSKSYFEAKDCTIHLTLRK